MAEQISTCDASWDEWVKNCGIRPYNETQRVTLELMHNAFKAGWNRRAVPEGVDVKLILLAGTAHFAPVQPVPENWSTLQRWADKGCKVRVSLVEEPK